MINSLVLIGRIVGEFKLTEEEGHKCCYITIASPRNFRNEEGEYETDFIDVKVLCPMCDTVSEYCENGDIIGIRGRIERLSQHKNMNVVAEKVTFLSQKVKEED